LGLLAKPLKAGPPSAAAPPLITALDLALVAGLPVLAALSWALPVRRWPSLCAAVARLAVPCPSRSFALGPPPVITCTIKRPVVALSCGSRLPV
jgi:hypothetical protein